MERNNEYKEWIVFFLLMVISLFNTGTLYLSLLFLIIYFIKQEAIGVIKILNFITLRTIVNPGLGINISNAQIFKWLIIMCGSLYLLSFYFKLEKVEKNKIKKVLFWGITFSIFNIITAIFFSSLPTVSIFKIFSFIIVISGVITGIFYTFRKINWFQWYFKLLTYLIMASLFLIESHIGYLKNGISLQGLTNQPNMFGILITLYIGMCLVENSRNKSKKITCYILISLFLIGLSNSRTSLGGSLLMILFYNIFNKKLEFKKIIQKFLIIGIVILMLFNNSRINSFFIDFFLKGQKNNFFASRVDQIGELIQNFESSPYFGTGFMVPKLSFRTYNFSFDYIVEPGNLLMAVLSFSGIIGFIIFLVFISKIILSNKKKFKILYFLPMSIFLINMGEMVFFSSNNIGIWIYMMLGIYMVYGENEVETEILDEKKLNILVHY